VFVYDTGARVSPCLLFFCATFCVVGIALRLVCAPWVCGLTQRESTFHRPHCSPDRQGPRTGAMLSSLPFSADLSSGRCGAIGDRPFLCFLFVSRFWLPFLRDYHSPLDISFFLENEWSSSLASRRCHVSPRKAWVFLDRVAVVLSWGWAGPVSSFFPGWRRGRFHHRRESDSDPSGSRRFPPSASLPVQKILCLRLLLTLLRRFSRPRLSILNCSNPEVVLLRKCLFPESFPFKAVLLGGGGSSFSFPPFRG